MNKVSSTPVRGDTYYLMDGSYGAYTFNTATSGTSTVVIKKAQSYDYGRTSDGCPNDISSGWNAATMGSSQAVFTGISTSVNARNYVTIDGNGTTTTPGCGTSPAVNTAASDCGIKLTSTQSSGDAIDFGSYNGFTTPTANWTFRYVEWAGGGDSPTTEQNGIWCRDGCTNLSMDHLWWHESGTDFLKIPAGSGLVVRNSHFKQNYDDSTNHGQFYIQEGDASNATFYNNIIQDIQGTAYWSMLTGAQMDGLYVYNNVLLKTQGSNRDDTSNGIFACINSGAMCSNVYFIGNSVINISGSYPTQGTGINSENNNASSYTWENNLFYEVAGLGFNIQSLNTFTEDHNSWLNTDSPVSGTGDVNITSGAPDPFVDWPNYDFHLATDNVDWEGGATLSSPYNVDMSGNPRPSVDGVWNRGAFQFSSDPPPATSSVGMSGSVGISGSVSF